MKLNVLGADNKIITLDINDIEIENHLKNPTSYIDCIVNKQINTDKIYDFFFKDKKNLTVIDAGANVGMFSIHCSPVSKVVYAIEPTPSHFKMLKKITEKFNNIVPINCALWKENNSLNFYEIGNNSTANSAVLSGGANKVITVEGKTLKKIVDENNISHIDLLKIDIEGAEFEILSEEFLEYCSNIVDNMFIEVHPVSGKCHDFNSCQSKVKQIFNNFKYKIKITGNDSIFIHR